MYAISLKQLVDKLNPNCHKALEGAAGLCQSNSHYEVDIEHLLLKLLEDDTADIARILSHFEVDASRVLAQLTTAISKFKTGNSRTPALSPRLSKLIIKSWLPASIQYHDSVISSGHLLLTLLAKPYFSADLLTSAE